MNEHHIIYTDRAGVVLLIEDRAGEEGGYARKVLYALHGDDSDPGRAEYAAGLADYFSIPAEPMS
jgi:hypothetical protein